MSDLSKFLSRFGIPTINFGSLYRKLTHGDYQGFWNDLPPQVQAGLRDFVLKEAGKISGGFLNG